MAYIAAVRQSSAQTGGNCCAFMQRVRGMRSHARIIRNSVLRLKNGFNDFCGVTCYAFFRRCSFYDKRNFYSDDGTVAKAAKL